MNKFYLVMAVVFAAFTIVETWTGGGRVFQFLTIHLLCLILARVTRDDK